LEPHFEVVGEWEQSILDSMETVTICDLRNRVAVFERSLLWRGWTTFENWLRRLGGRGFAKTTTGSAARVVLQTAIMPLLPERRPQCDVFLLVARARA
jgi:hypothetical protein